MLVKRKEVQNIIGKSGGIFGKKFTMKSYYISGINEFYTEKGITINPVNYLKKGGALSSFYKYSEGLYLTISYVFTMRHIPIPFDWIDEVIIEKGNLIETKEKSVVGGAITGSIFGSTGAVVGAINAMKGKEIREKDKLIIKYKYNSQDRFALFILKKDTKEAYDFFKSIFLDKFSLIQ